MEMAWIVSVNVWKRIFLPFMCLICGEISAPAVNYPDEKVVKFSVQVSRTPIAITLLVKKTKADETPATIYYHDIGDYLSREDKLAILRKFGSIEHIEWQQLSPNKHGDWLNQRNDAFENFIPLAPEKKFV